MLKLIAASCVSLMLAGCGTTTIARYPASPPYYPNQYRQKLVVVIDGTSNDPRDRTNASRMHELISNQNRPNLSVFYTEGVGSDARVIGMASGWGMAKDVRDAYRYLAETWQPGEGPNVPPGDIFLFGFSRGAFGGRILTGLIYTAGLIDFRPPANGAEGYTLKQRQAIVDDIYDAYKTPRASDGSPIQNPTPAQRKEAVDAVIGARGVQRSGYPRIKAVGYWDTVGAMGFPDNRIEPYREEKSRYLDQFCNVDKVFHATSLDDTRAFDFTPLLASGPKTFEQCDDTNIDEKVDEVWFSGAHADVGGAYSNDEQALEGHLPGVSLNWMIARINEIDPDLLPRGAGQYANPYDMVHDSQLGLALWKARPRAFRDVMGWSSANAYNRSRPKIHISVAQRFAMLFEIERAFAPQCNSPRKEPALLCASDLTQEDREPTPFLAALVKAGCAKRQEGTDGATGKAYSGFILAGEPVRVGTREAALDCVTLSFDTFEQREAFMNLQLPPTGRIPSSVAELRLRP